MTTSLQAIYPDDKRSKATFSPAIRAGDFLFISGTTAVDDNRQIVGDDIAAQARFIYQKIGRILVAAGVGFDAVVETVDYVTTFDGYERTADVRREIFGTGPFPAATGVLISGLVRPGALIEIKATAYIGKRA
jgi:enamine deaminase RidA (YjgF/YER057c/UK114 family)